MATPCPSLRRSASFDEILPLLVNVYQAGRLVPFLGAGMSANKLTLWPEFLKKLEAEADLDPAKCELTMATPDARAQRARTRIENRYGWNHFLESVRTALKGSSNELPAQTSRLSEICWPLVVSTNYDDLFFYSCRCNPESPHYATGGIEVQVLGRSARDCKLVISSLTGPFDRQYIWHIQGFLGGQFGRDVKTDVPNLRSLEEQMVVGHAEYRAVTNRAPDFRRCFGELFNLRSFLFLGTSLKEDYFLNLFGEVLDLCGPSAVPHFAFTKKGEVDSKFLADQMNITVCEFDDWPDLPKWLKCLSDEVKQSKICEVRRSYAMGLAPNDNADLEIVGAPASLDIADDEVLAIVAKRNPDNGFPQLEEPFDQLDLAGARSHGEHIFQFEHPRVYAVTARIAESDSDDAVYRACLDLLKLLCETCTPLSNVHLQMSRLSGSVPPIYGFMEAVRTFARWKRCSGSALRLTVHIEQTVRFNLASGRIDIRELLSSDQIRFWAVVYSGGNREPVRRALRYPPETKLATVLKDIDLPFADGSENWYVSLCPSPRRGAQPRIACELLELSLIEVGVAFGSVLILEYAVPADEFSNSANQGAASRTRGAIAG